MNPPPHATDYPEMVKPGCTAYFHIPPAWMGSEPTQQECLTAPEEAFTQVVFKRTLIHGISVHIQRDGVFLFDCRGWPEAGETIIPSHPRVIGPVPDKVTAAERLGEQRANKRAQIINVHQACLCSALQTIRHRGQGIGDFVLPFQAYQIFRVEVALPKWDYDLVQHFAATMTDYGNAALRRSQPFYRRRFYELDVIAGSFNLLEEIIRHPVSDLLELTELVYRSSAQYCLNRFQESLILSWCVCERFLNILWKRYLDEQNAVAPAPTLRIGKERKQKLTGRDFTASIITETLELAGRIPQPMFERLNAARKARNDWMHGLKPISEGDAMGAIRAALELYQLTSGIKLMLNFGRSDGSGGSMPKADLEQWDRQQAKARKGDLKGV